MAGAPPPLSGSAAEGKPVATNAPELGVTSTPLPAEPGMPAGLDAAGQAAAGALKLQFGTTLAGDAETLLYDKEANYKYQRELTPKEYERTAIRQGREINEGIAQSGMAAGNRARDVTKFLGQRQGQQLKAQLGINRAERSYQEAYNKENQALGGIVNASTQRKEQAKIKNPEQSPPPTPPGTGAAAAVAQAFPGGEAEHILYVKASPADKANWYNLPAHVRNPGGTAQRARGGPVASGRPYLVGERGPEIMVPKTSGRIIRNAAVRKAMKR